MFHKYEIKTSRIKSGVFQEGKKAVNPLMCFGVNGWEVTGRVLFIDL